MTAYKVPKKRTLQFSEEERRSSEFLVVESDSTIRSNLKQMISSLGYASITDAPDHVAGLQKFGQRRITHIVFEAKKTTMPAKDFIQKVLDTDPNIVALATSFEPSVDDVFSLLMMGARGYIVKPFTQDAIDAAILMASKGDPISDAILYAKDRNEALAALTLTALDKLATVKRQAESFPTAEREVPHAALYLQRAIDLSRTFAKGGQDALLESIIEFCMERANGPASKLGRLRKRLEAKKGAVSSSLGSANPEN